MKRNGILLALVTLLVVLGVAGCQSSDSQQTTDTKKEIESCGGEIGAADRPAAPQVEPDEGGGAPGPGPGPGPQVDPNARLAEEMERVRIEDEKRDVVAQYFFDAAEKFYRETKYQEARGSLLEAIKLQPRADLLAKAQSLLREVEELLGIGGSGEAVRLEQEVAIHTVKVSQAVQKVQVLIEEGRADMGKNQYEEAIKKFDSALEILRWLPYHTPKRVLQAQLEDLKETAIKRKRDWDLEQAAKNRDEARLAEELEERDRQKFMEERISQLFRNANIEFRKENYDLSEKFADQILELDPFNKDAKRLQEISVRARHAKVADRNLDMYIEEWKNTWEGVNKKIVPQHTVIRYPDADTWKKVVNRQTEERPSDTLQLPAEEREIMNKLETQVVGRLEFESHPLTEVIEFLRDNFDLNMMIDPDLTKNRTEEELRVSLKVSDLPLKDALELILSITKLGYQIEHGVIVIKERDQIQANSVSRVYPVQDLTLGIQDFPGIDLDLVSGDQQGGLGTSFGDTTAAAEPLSIDLLRSLIEENISAGSWDPPNSITARSGRLIIRHTNEVHAEIERLLMQLRQSTGLLVSIETRFLTVRDDFLQDIGVDFRGLGAQSPRGNSIQRRAFRFPGVNPVVAPALQAADRMGRVTPNINPLLFFNSAGMDSATGESNLRSARGGFRRTTASLQKNWGLVDAPMDDVLFGVPGAPAGVGTDNTAGISFDNGDTNDVRGRIEHLFATAFGTTSILTNSGGLNLQFGFLDEVGLNMILKAVEKSERINLLTAPRVTAFNTQRANVAVLRQFGYIKDFDVQVAQNATVADPIIGIVQDGVVLDVKPVISADRKFITMELQPAFAEVDLPLRQFVTTLGQTGQAVTIELPRVVLRKVQTTVTIPDGGTILIGGLTDFQEKERTSDVPFFKRVPFLSFFFAKKQKLTFRSNLVVLVRAEIVYWKEIEPNPGLQR
ncbi:MAG: hypothetical protein HY720_24820 [Planctomycetes bacterium]|nr:hypothetical protein [Planctomycetota bacterium]